MVKKQTDYPHTADMTNIHTPLGQLDNNAQMANPFDTTPDVDAKPAATFTQESQQHRSLHNKLLRQEQYEKMPLHRN